VQLEDREPLFHAPWERRALGLTLAMGATGQWNIDQSRSARESLPPATYLGSSYYRIWILALERLMARRGLVTEEELSAGQLRTPALPAAVARALRNENVDAALARGTPTERPATSPARFAVGDRVSRYYHPLEWALFALIAIGLDTVLDALTALWKRVRPPVADPQPAAPC
jgi:nitrile hydratase